MKSYLLRAEPLVDPTLKMFAEKKPDKLFPLLIALRRIRERFMDYFEYFLELLKKIQKHDPNLFIYPRYVKFLSKHLGGDIMEHLYEYLDSKGYDEANLSRIYLEKDFNEGAFINRLPKDNVWYLLMCIFFLYQPLLSQKFFWEELEYLEKEEKDLLSNYRALSNNLQDKVSEYVARLVKGEVLRKTEMKLKSSTKLTPAPSSDG